MIIRLAEYLTIASILWYGYNAQKNLPSWLFSSVLAKVSTPLEIFFFAKLPDKRRHRKIIQITKVLPKQRNPAFT